MSDLKVYPEEHWDKIIEPGNRWSQVSIKEIWRYRDLIMLFVRRDFVAQFKQTILGPAWFFIQPLLTTITFTLIFGKIAEISTDGVPQLVFYLSGVTIWNYFADCLTKTSETFIANQRLFGKVYFPRVVVPISIVVSNLFRLGVQMLLFLAVFFFFLFFGAEETQIQPNLTILLTPIYVLDMALLGLGLGMIVTSLTTKYRDLRFLIQFGVQLLMFATPVVYPLSVTEGGNPKFRMALLANPITSVVEGFRHAFLGTGEFLGYPLLYSTIVGIIVFTLGMFIFQKTEKSFIDTV